MKSFLKRVSPLAVVGLASASQLAHATAPATVSDLVGAVDFTSVGVAILAVFAAAIAMVIVVKGGQWVYHKVKSV